MKEIRIIAYVVNEDNHNVSEIEYILPAGQWSKEDYLKNIDEKLKELNKDLKEIVNERY